MTGEHEHLVAPRSHVSQEMREKRRLHRGMVFWLTGLSGSGKSTLAHEAEKILFEQGYEVIVLDGDVIRTGLCRDLGFTHEHRQENNRRIAELSKILVRSGIVCLCAFISPSAEARGKAKEIIGDEFFREIFISCPVEECERRDPKAFYTKARKGDIRNYTGVSAGYDKPESPDLLIETQGKSIEECVRALHAFIVGQAGH